MMCIYTYDHDGYFSMDISNNIHGRFFFYYLKSFEEREGREGGREGGRGREKEVL